MLSLVSGSNSYGGSTITQQVAKNFLLSNEKTFERQENKGRTINKEVSIDSPVKMNNDSGNTHTYEEILPDTRFMIDDSADELLYLADQSGIKGLREMLEYDALGYRPSEVASMKGEKEKTYMRRRSHRYERFKKYLEEVGYNKR